MTVGRLAEYARRASIQIEAAPTLVSATPRPIIAVTAEHPHMFARQMRRDGIDLEKSPAPIAPIVWDVLTGFGFIGGITAAWWSFYYLPVAYDWLEKVL